MRASLEEHVEEEEYVALEPEDVVDPDMVDEEAGVSTCLPAAQADSCHHPCGLSGHCCICITRAPRPGVIPNLCAWWQQRGLSPVTIVTGRWRFFCSQCAARCSSPETCGASEVLPLPFGGKLTSAEELTTAEELVEPVCQIANFDEDWSNADLSSVGGSWVAVSQPGLQRTASDSSWVLPDAVGSQELRSNTDHQRTTLRRRGMPRAASNCS